MGGLGQIISRKVTEQGCLCHWSAIPVQRQLIPQINSSDFKAGPLTFGAPFSKELFKELSPALPTFQVQSHLAKVGERAWHRGPEAQARKGPLARGSVLPPSSTLQVPFLLCSRHPVRKPSWQKAEGILIYSEVARE